MRSIAPSMSLLALAVTLGACTVTIAPAPSQQTSADCQGVSAGRSVAGHDGCNPPTVAVDVSRQIHDYILGHPEIIAEAQRGLAIKQAAERQVQAKAALSANRDAVFFAPSDPILGNPKGDVTLVAFTDYECPFCKKLSPEVDKLIVTDPGVRVVVKEFPILGAMSDTAARYALAAKAQGNYSAFHSALMGSTVQEHQLTEAQILDFAKKSGLDLERLKRDAAEPAIAAQIVANRALAQKLAVSSTPSLMITGTSPDSAQLVTVRDLQGLQEAVYTARMSKVTSAQ